MSMRNLVPLLVGLPLVAFGAPAVAFSFGPVPGLIASAVVTLLVLALVLYAVVKQASRGPRPPRVQPRRKAASERPPP